MTDEEKKAKKRAYMIKYCSNPENVKKRLETRKRWYHRNKDKSNSNVRKWQRLHKDRTREQQLKRNYGITKEQYNAILLEQNNVCAICGGNNERALSVDHSHTTGEIRGLLCRNCNNGLGLFKDNVDILLKAIKYLTNKQ